MRIAYCISGFARCIHSSTFICDKLKSSLPGDAIIDFFWYCPRKIDSETNTEDIDTISLIETFKLTGLGEVEFEFFDYNPLKFYDKVIDFGFTLDSIINSIPTPSRKLSDIYNRSNSIRLAYEYSKKHSIVYDWVILTRNDYLPYIKKFGVPSSNDTIVKGVYNYRTSPYRTSIEQGQDGILDTEDRGFFGSPEYMFELRYFYDTLTYIYTNAKTFNENLHTLFFYHIFGANVCNYIEGSDIIFPQVRKSDTERSTTNYEIEYYTNHKNSLFLSTYEFSNKID
jgi:hypothetical protein